MAIIAGVDEAGRGPLAGPVVAAAVVLPDKHSIEGLDDSKKLTARRRDLLFDLIIDQAVAIGIGRVDQEEIDRINILQATYRAMQMALGRTGVKIDRALIDGYALPNQVVPNEGVIGGDREVDCIKAASIIAKVTRDRLMIKLAAVFPEYGFQQHKGYGTRQHLDALIKFKATPIHRRSFKPVAECLPTLNWLQENKRIGWWGERLACLNLIKQGNEIIETNHTISDYGEIDIIAESEYELIFTEVKTVYKSKIGSPEDKIDRQKLEKLNRAIEHYLVKNNISKDVRLDAVTVKLQRGGTKIKHFKGLELD